MLYGFWDFRKDAWRLCLCLLIFFVGCPPCTRTHRWNSLFSHSLGSTSQHLWEIIIFMWTVGPLCGLISDSGPLGDALVAGFSTSRRHPPT